MHSLKRGADKYSLLLLFKCVPKRVVVLTDMGNRCSCKNDIQLSYWTGGKWQPVRAEFSFGSVASKKRREKKKKSLTSEMSIPTCSLLLPFICAYTKCLVKITYLYLETVLFASEEHGKDDMLIRTWRLFFLHQKNITYFSNSGKLLIHVLTVLVAGCIILPHGSRCRSCTGYF